MIEKVFVISLANRQDRLDNFLSQLPTLWTFPTIDVYTAIDGTKESIPTWWKSTPGAWGCYRSHHEIIKICIDKKIQSVLIFEDDAIFRNNFIEQSNKILTNLPKNWEMCYFGGQHLKKPSDKVINNIVGIGTNINRTHAYAINGSGFTKLDKYLSKYPWPINKHHIDHMYGYLHQNQIIEAYCPLEMLVGQNSGPSDVVSSYFPIRWWSKKN